RAAPPGEVRDDLGRAVALEAVPEAVVPLAPNLTELVAVAAGTDRLAGVALADDFPPAIDGLPRFQSFPLDAEAVVALQPDLVLGSTDVTPTDQADRLGGLGLPTYLFQFDEVADVPRALRTLDTLLASTAGAEAALAFESRTEAVARAVRTFRPPRTLLLVGSGEGILYAFGEASYASEMVRLAGGDNLTDVYDGAAAQPSVEAVLEMAPEVVIVASEGTDAEALVADHPALFSIPAVTQGRVYGVDPDLVLRPGPRIADGLERIARLLHPEAFAAGAA
ncbi:MAG: ABC transporter substrate-binding protein, partial [Bacteroidota bacterium]